MIFPNEKTVNSSGAGKIKTQKEQTKEPAHRIKAKVSSNTKKGDGLKDSEVLSKKYVLHPISKIKQDTLKSQKQGKESSEGVHDFIKSVSHYLERKRLLKEKSNKETFKTDTQQKKNIGLGIKKVDKETKTKQLFSKESNVESNKILSSNIVKKEKIIKQLHKKAKGESSQSSLEYSVTGNKSDYEEKTLELSFMETNAHADTHKKVLKPSEIPLWKNRTKLLKKAKHVSLIMEKPFKNTESSDSIEICSNKAFSSFEQRSTCSEKQNEKQFNAKLSKTSIVTNDFTEFQSADSVVKTSEVSLSYEYRNKAPERILESLRKTKFLNLNKVRSSSLTSLTNNSNTFIKLESFHEKNVNASQDISSFATSPRSPFTSSLAKNTKKNVENRLSSKGNKPSLKSKVKKDEVLLKNERKIVKKVEGRNVQKAGNEEFHLSEETLRTLVVKGKSLFSDTLSTSPETLKMEAKALKALTRNVEKQLSNKSPFSSVNSYELDDLLTSSFSSTPNDVSKPKNENKELKVTEHAKNLIVKHKSENEKYSFEQEERNNQQSEENSLPAQKEKSLEKTTASSFDWLYLNYKRCSEELYSKPVSDFLPAEEEKLVKTEAKVILPEEEMVEKHSAEKKAKTVAVKKKKKLRSDTIDRWKHPSSEHNLVSSKHETMRKELTSSADLELKSSVDLNLIFEEAAAKKLRRRSSEPTSFRGFVWKKTDLAVSKDAKTSVSSLASSLKHLNTDEMEDFIFWEAVPQKMTSCWEMSLYHFKRPWSVLSCAVFKDNRESTTPGLILSNLKGVNSNSTKCILMCDDEKPKGRKENSFDVEPSIAQKNIDIKNWLSALNFPTRSSTSTDALSEGAFHPGTPFGEHEMNILQPTPKRRRGLPILKISDEDKKRHKDSRKWDSREMGNLMGLVRRKSGGFVTSEQFLNSEVPCPPQNVAINFCTCDSLGEEKSVFHDIKTKALNQGLEVNEKGEGEEFEIKEIPIEELISENADKCQKEKEKEDGKSESFSVRSTVSEDLVFVPPVLNVWKYIFIVTVCLITAYYFFPYP